MADCTNELLHRKWPMANCHFQHWCGVTEQNVIHRMLIIVYWNILVSRSCSNNCTLTMGMANLVSSRLQYPHVQTHTSKTWVLCDTIWLTVVSSVCSSDILSSISVTSGQKTLSLAVGIATHFPPHEHLYAFIDKACKHAIK